MIPSAGFIILLNMSFPLFRFSDKSKTEDNIERHLEDLELPLFDLQTIASATNNFSLNNKIGQGGFGSVYKVTEY